MEHCSRLKNKILDAPIVEHCVAMHHSFEDLKCYVIYKYEHKRLQQGGISKRLYFVKKIIGSFGCICWHSRG